MRIKRDIGKILGIVDWGGCLMKTDKLSWSNGLRGKR